MNHATSRGTAPRLATPTDLGANAAKDIAGALNGILADTYADLNPAAIQRQIQALTTELLTLTTSKAGAVSKPAFTRAPVDESTKATTRAS